MFIDELKSYYGEIDPAAESFINDLISRYTFGELSTLRTNFFAKFPRDKFPDIAGLSKFFDNNKPKNSIFYWSKCDHCGTIFDYKFCTCPICYKKEKKRYGYKVVVAETKPPASIIRWNKTWFTDDEVTCVNCEVNPTENYCFHFGDPDYQCSREQFEYCECKKCCLNFRNKNRKMAEGKA